MNESLFFRQHVFFCQNKREGEACCADHDTKRLRDYAKRRLKELGEHGEGRVRINQAGCLGRCDDGPVIVVYPEGVWYTYLDESDIDEIIESHLLGGKVVERLLIDGEGIV